MMYPPSCVDAVNAGHLIQGMQFLEMVTGGGAAQEVMGHSQDAPHGANSVGACPMWGMPTARDGNDEAYWTCPTFTGFSTTF